MKKNIPLIILLFLCAPINVIAQQSLPTDYFRSANNGDWNNSSSWQSSRDNVLFTAATQTPTAVASKIVIHNGHTITINSTGVSLINTNIQNGAILQIAAAAPYEIGDAPGDDLVIDSGGVLLLNFQGTTTPAAPSGNGTALVKTGGMVIAAAAGNGTVAKSIGDNYLGLSSKFTYADKAIFEWKISAYLFFAGTGANDYFKTLSASDIPVLKFNTLLIVEFKSSGDNKFNALLDANTPLIFSGTGTKQFRGGLTGSSIINQTGGAIILPNAVSVLNGSLTINIISNGLVLNNGAIISAGANIKISGTVEDQNINKITGNLQINGTLDITDCTINNAGAPSTVTIANGGILKTSNKDGFSGTGATIVSTTGIIVLENNSSIEFNRQGDQNFKARADFKNLIFSGSGIKKPGSSIDPEGTIKITESAILDCTGHNAGGANTHLTMDGGRLIVSTGSTQPKMQGLYTLTGGVVEFAGTSSKSIRSATYQNIEVSGADVNNSSGNIVLQPSGSFTIKNGGVFSINDNGITGPTGTQTVTIENGAIFNCGNNQGFHGFTASFSNNSSIHYNIENIVLMPGSTVNYFKNANQVISNTHKLVYQNLTISGTSGNKTAPSDTLMVEGDFLKINESNYVHNKGTVIFKNKYAVQNYTCTSTTGVQFYKLVNNNSFTAGAGLSINNNMSIENTLVLADSSMLSLASGNITLLSTANYTAGIGEVPTTASINYGVNTGRFVVERYYPNSFATAPRAWRLVTVPLLEANTIYEAWQLSAAGYGVSNYNRGTFVTGPPTGTNGLDSLQTDSFSLKKYDGANFVGLQDTQESSGIGTGYLLFVRGDRNPALSNPANSSYTTLSNRGKLQTGSINIAVNGNMGLMGNPYASPVDFARLDKFNINQHRFYIWDPKINRVGAYVLMEDLATPGIFKPTAPHASSAQDNFIQSCQAFFVEKINPGLAASVSFKESDKTANYNAASFKPLTGSDAANDFVKANLYLLNADNTTILADGNMAEFNEQYIAGVDMNDAVKLSNINESFSLVRTSNQLAVERRPAITAGDTLFFKLTATTQRSYQFVLNISSSNQAVKAYWQDAYTHANTLLNTFGTTSINFTVTADTLSAALNRFRLVFVNSNNVLAVIFKSLELQKKDKNIELKWYIENEIAAGNYTIEKSTDGRLFKQIGQLSHPIFSGSNAYKWMDEQPVEGINFYRINYKNKYAEDFYSPIAKIKWINRADKSEININLSSNGSINLSMQNLPAGIYQIRLINYLGQILGAKLITHSGGNLVANLIFTQANLMPNPSIIEVLFPDKIKQIFKLVL